MPPKDSKREKAREVVDILQEISILLNTNLDRAQLSLCVSLIENGVNPEALALLGSKNAIKDLRKEADGGLGDVNNNNNNKEEEEDDRSR